MIDVESVSHDDKSLRVNVMPKNRLQSHRQSLGYEWFVYPEAGTYRGTVTVADAATARARLQIPADAVGKTIHVILAVRDQGTPSLAGYRRALVSCVEARQVNP